MAKIQLVKNLFNTFVQPQSCQATATATTAASNVASLATAGKCKMLQAALRTREGTPKRERERERDGDGEAKRQIEEGERQSEPAGWWRIAWHFCNQRYANVAA